MTKEKLLRRYKVIIYVLHNSEYDQDYVGECAQGICHLTPLKLTQYIFFYE